MTPDFLEDVSSFLTRLKQDTLRQKGNLSLEKLMRDISEGRVKIRWGQGLKASALALKKPNVLWLRYLISSPIIYAMLCPISFLDIAVSVYQATCFRLWKLKQVQRNSYVIIDRQSLEYLNWFQKINCMYCGYANGVFAYAKAIAGETERYWCPVKHNAKILEPHDFYIEFAEYDDAEGWDNLHSGGLENWGSKSSW